MDLEARLLSASRAWCNAHRPPAPLSRLGKRVAGAAGYFDRLQSADASTTTATLAKFARFFADEGNWPDGRIPAEAIAFCHVNGISVGVAAPADAAQERAA